MSEEKIYCIYCGAVVEKGATFCPNCGAALTKSEPTPSVYSTTPASQPTAASTQEYAQPQPAYQPVTVVHQPAPPPAKTDDSLAMVSLITGILGWICMPGVLSIVAIITGHIALSKGKSPMAVVGLVFGYIPIVGLIIYLIVMLSIGWWI